MKKIWAIGLLLMFGGCTNRTTFREPVSYLSNYQIIIPNVQICGGRVYNYYQKVGCSKYIGNKFQEIVMDLNLCEGDLQIPIQGSVQLSPAGIISTEVVVNGTRNIYCEEGSPVQKTSISCLPGFINFGTEYCLSPQMEIKGFYSYSFVSSAMAVDSLGKIYVGGNFDSYQLFSNGIGQSTYYGNSLLKLNQDWSDSWNFSLGPVNFQGWISDLIVDETDNFYISGTFNQINGQTAQKIAKIKSDGNLDSSFNANSIFSNVLKIKQDPKSKKIYVLGYMVNSPALKIVRLNANGSIDGSFLESIVVGEVHSLQIDLNSRLYLIGKIDYYRNVPVFGSVRILSSGELDESLNLYRTDIVYLDRKNNKLYMSREDLKLSRLNLEDNTYSSDFYIGPLELNGEVKGITVDSDSEKVYLIGSDLYNNYVQGSSIRLNKNGSFDYTFTDPFVDDGLTSEITELQYKNGWLMYRTQSSFGMRHIGN